MNESDPVRADLTETHAFLAVAQKLGIRLINITLGSPYYNPHLTRPAIYPPSDGYKPPEDPLVIPKCAGSILNRGPLSRTNRTLRRMSSIISGTKYRGALPCRTRNTV